MQGQNTEAFRQILRNDPLPLVGTKRRELKQKDALGMHAMRPYHFLVDSQSHTLLSARLSLLTSALQILDLPDSIIL